MLELSPARSNEADAVIAALLPGHAWGEGAVARLVKRLRRNKYPLLALEDAGKRHRLLAASETWSREVDADRRELEAQRREFVMVRRAWLDAGIPSVLFKSAGIAPSFPYTSDNLDVLVPRARCDEARRILLSMGYVWLRNIDETQKFLFRKFQEGRSVSAVHVHSWIGWDVEFHEDSVWDGVRQSADDREVMVPSAEDAILVNTAHALYENKEIRLYDLEKVRSQWSGPLDWEYMERVARRRGWLDGLYFALLLCTKMERSVYGYNTVGRELVQRWETGLREYRLQYAYWQRARKRDVVLPFRVSFAFSKLLYYKKILRDDHDGVGARVSNLIHTLAWGVKQKSKVRPQPGRLITISGIDGTGKTAHARALSEAMETSEVINTVVWSRCGCSPVYRAVTSLVRRFAGSSAAPIAAADLRAVREPPAPGLWAWFNALDLALVYQWRVRLPLLTGKVVIADRYTFDAAVEIAHRTGVAEPMRLAAVRALVALAPKPDAAYLLDAPARLAAYRSADPEDVRDLEQQRALYRRVVDDARMRLLDVSQTFAEANDRLVREVLQAYEDSFDTLTNGLLLSNPSQMNRSQPRALAPFREGAGDEPERDAA